MDQVISSMHFSSASPGRSPDTPGDWFQRPYKSLLSPRSIGQQTGLLLFDFHRFQAFSSLQSISKTEKSKQTRQYSSTASINSLTTGFPVSVRLLRSRSQMMPKCAKNKKVAHEAIAAFVTDVLTTV